MTVIENPIKIGFIPDIIREDIKLAVVGNGRDLESILYHVDIDQYLGHLQKEEALSLKNSAIVLLSDP